MVIKARSLDGLARVQARQLSDGGIFLRTPDPRPVGRPANVIVIGDREDKRVELAGCVVGSVRGAQEAWVPGMQIDFVRPDDRARQLVGRVIQVFNEAHPQEGLRLPEELEDEDTGAQTSPVGRLMESLGD